MKSNSQSNIIIYDRLEKKVYKKNESTGLTHKTYDSSHEMKTIQ